jgi:hypothetical protein
LLLIIVAAGALNVCLGFAVAWYLGYGPPGLREAWEALAPIPRKPQTPSPAASPAGEAAPVVQDGPAQAAGNVAGSEAATV